MILLIWWNKWFRHVRCLLSKTFIIVDEGTHSYGDMLGFSLLRVSLRIKVGVWFSVLLYFGLHLDILDRLEVDNLQSSFTGTYSQFYYILVYTITFRYSG